MLHLLCSLKSLWHNLRNLNHRQKKKKENHDWLFWFYCRGSDHNSFLPFSVLTYWFPCQNWNDVSQWFSPLDWTWRERVVYFIKIKMQFTEHLDQLWLLKLGLRYLCIFRSLEKLWKSSYHCCIHCACLEIMLKLSDTSCKFPVNMRFGTWCQPAFVNISWHGRS